MVYENLYEDDDFDILFEEDDGEYWDEGVKENLDHILSRHPGYSHIVRIRNFTRQTLSDIDDWLNENCEAKFERIGWSAGCSTSVGVVFTNSMDAVMFKLRWC